MLLPLYLKNKNFILVDHNDIEQSIKNKKTVGILENNEADGYMEIADPLGVIAGVTPVTNPTSTTIFKSLSYPASVPELLRSDFRYSRKSSLSLIFSLLTISNFSGLVNDFFTVFLGTKATTFLLNDSLKILATPKNYDISTSSVTG